MGYVPVGGSIRASEVGVASPPAISALLRDRFGSDAEAPRLGASVVYASGELLVSGLISGRMLYCSGSHVKCGVPASQQTRSAEGAERCPSG